MNLKEHYDNLYSECLQKVKSSNFSVDELIDSASDDRYGITLLIRLPLFIKNNIQKFHADLKIIEPGQYYYRNSDIHVTVLSIISCCSGFKLSRININDYSILIANCLVNTRKFNIHFKGITATLNGIMIQGFIRDNTLNDMRDKLRSAFTKSDLEHSFDIRYKLQTAHATVVRFRTEVTNKLNFLDVLETYRDFDFGSFDVDSLELVGNDWYLKKEKVKRLGVFRI